MTDMLSNLFVPILFVGIFNLNQGLQVTVTPSPVARVLYGDPLTLSCTISPGWTSMVWDRGSGWVLVATNNTCGNNNTNLRLYVTCHGNTIQLHKLQPEEGETYKCIGQPNHPNESASPFTTVQIYADGPLFRLNHEVVKVRETEDARLICEGRGGPNITLRWTKENGNTPGVINRSPGKVELLVTNVTRSQSGKYTCDGSFEFRNVQYQNSTSLEVDVQYAPDVSIQGVNSVPAGGNVTLSCTAHGNPRSVDFRPWKHFIGSTFIRELEGSISGQRNDTNTLLIEDVQPTDFGTYVCGADNGILGRNDKLLQESSATLSVQYSPIVMERNSSKTYFEERDKKFELTFVYLANPPTSFPIITKEESNLTLQNNSRITIFSKPINKTYSVYGTDAVVMAQELTVKFSPVKEMDSGSYEVHLQNTESSTDNYFEIYALEQPVMPSSLKFDPYPDSITLHWEYGIKLDEFHSFEVMCQSKKHTCQNVRLEFNETQTDYWYNMPNLSLSSEYSMSVCSENPLGRRCTTTFIVKTTDPYVIGESKQQTSENVGQDDSRLISIISAACGVAVLCIILIVVLGRRSRRKNRRRNGRGSLSSQISDGPIDENHRAVPNRYVTTPRLSAKPKLESVDGGYLTPEEVPNKSKLDEFEKNIYDVIPAYLVEKDQEKKRKDSPDPKKKRKVFVKSECQMNVWKTNLANTRPGITTPENQYNTIPGKDGKDSPDPKKKRKIFGKTDKQTNTGIHVAKPVDSEQGSTTPENQYNTIPMQDVKGKRESTTDSFDQTRTEEKSQFTEYLEPVSKVALPQTNAYMEMRESKHPVDELEKKENLYAKSLKECGYVAMNKVSDAGKDTTTHTEGVSDDSDVQRFDAYKY